MCRRCSDNSNILIHTHTHYTNVSKASQIFLYPTKRSAYRLNEVLAFLQIAKRASVLLPLTRTLQAIPFSPACAASSRRHLAVAFKSHILFVEPSCIQRGLKPPMHITISPTVQKRTFGTVDLNKQMGFRNQSVSEW